MLQRKGEYSSRRYFPYMKVFLMYLANIICTNICMCGGYRKVRCYFSEAVHLGFFWERVFHWHGALPSLLGWLASKPQESAHLCLQVECWDYTIHYPTQLFKMGSTDWAQVLMFAKEALNWLSCFPRRYVQFWLTLLLSRFYLVSSNSMSYYEVNVQILYKK